MDQYNSQRAADTRRGETAVLDLVRPRHTCFHGCGVIRAVAEEDA